MAHVREEAGLQIGDALESLGVVVELGVEGHDAAVGLLKLAGVHLGDLGLAIAQLLKGAEQLLVLLLELFEKSLGGVPRQLGRDSAELDRCKGGRALGQTLGHRDRGPARLIGFDLEPVHQPPGADDPERPEPASARVLAVEDRLKVLDPRASLADADHEGRRGPGFDQELDRPPPAYWKALRAISDVAVAMRVWSSWAKPSSPAIWRARCRARTTSGSRRISRA